MSLFLTVKKECMKKIFDSSGKYVPLNDLNSYGNLTNRQMKLKVRIFRMSRIFTLFIVIFKTLAELHNNRIYLIGLLYMQDNQKNTYQSSVSLDG